MRFWSRMAKCIWVTEDRKEKDSSAGPVDITEGWEEKMHRVNSRKGSQPPEACRKRRGAGENRRGNKAL